MRSGKQAVVEQLVVDGFRYVFGNPGTVEQGLLDEIDRCPELTYVLGLQETVAVGMADGFARASGGPALVQLHSGVGLGNAIGLLYQARRGHSPLVALAGDAGVRYDAMDAQMAADLVGMARPVTKWAARATDPASVLRLLRRAVKIAMTPPRGPVFLDLPMDVLDAPNTEDVRPTSLLHTAATPAAELVDAAARLLAGAQRPIVLVGDGVHHSGAQAELTRVAERLGADIWGVDFAEANVDGRHPLYRGLVGHMFGEVSRAVVASADAVLVVGTYLFPEVFPDLTSPFRPDARIVQIDLDGYEIAKNHPVTLGLVADPKATLAALDVAVAAALTPADAAAAAGRVERRMLERPVAPAADPDQDCLLRVFLRELRDRAPADLVVFDEGLTASGDIGEFFPPGRPGDWFLTRGGSLGVGIPGAIGAQIARPDQTVVGFTGDGGSMYTIQALATAARYGIGARFVVCNNHRYGLLDRNIAQYWRERDIAPHTYPRSFGLSRPELGFVDIARGHGVEAVRVEKTQQVEEAVERMLGHEGPFLVDLLTDGSERA